MLEWIRENPTLFALLIWPMFSAVVSVLYKYADGIPRFHAFLSVLVGLGFDLPKVLDAIRRAATGEEPPTPPQMKSIGSVRPPKDREPPPVCRRVALLLAAALCLTGCAWLTPARVKDINDATAVGLCILDHATESPAQIVLDCSGATVQLVEDFLAAQARAEARRHAGGCADAGVRP